MFLAIAFLFGAAAARETALRDGFALAGADGKLTGKHDRWFFKFDSDVSDGKGLIKAGTGVELLPSAALEKMTADAKAGVDATYRLWGRVTEYKGKNFIFPIYFLPVQLPIENRKSKIENRKPTLTINEPNDALIIPEEIIAKLQTRKTIRPQQLRKGLELKQDSILADRTGFISSCVVRDAYCGKEKTQNTQYAIRNTQYDFVLDALGRNVLQNSFELLPCQVLEQAEQAQSAEPDRLRFKVAGIVTKYKGKRYLLLQKATRVYSHGNFGR